MAPQGLDEPVGHFVYLYRDKKGKPRYVGYGKGSGRACSHLARSRNEALKAFLATGEYDLEIAGPFGTEEMGRAVETALISSLKPDCNLAKGENRWRFRPLGVPSKFADRLGLPPLERKDFLRPIDGGPARSVLFVHIASTDFEDRPGYHLENPATDVQILDRMDKYWQIGRYIPKWRDHPEQSPALLIGLSGGPKNRIVIGAVPVDQTRWKDAESDCGLFHVPVLKHSSLDAGAYRGRKVSIHADMRFGATHSQFFIILKRNGTIIGGRIGI